MKKNIRVPYALPVFGEKEVKAVIEVLKTPMIVAGRKASEFENKISSLFGKKYGVYVNSGSSANLLALESLNLPKGSEVITPILTFSTTVAPIVKLGLIPAFIDVEPSTYLIDVNKVEGIITKKTKALMIPSLFGNIPDLENLRKIAKKHNLYLIEDSCDTLGATIKGKSTGIYSDISTTSFYATHLITAAGEGGMICFNNLKHSQKARILSGWGRYSSLNETENIDVRLKGRLKNKTYDSKFIFPEIGYNMRTTDISAAFGLVQLTRLKEFISLRQNNFDELINFFSKYKNFFVLPKQSKVVKTAWMSFPLTLTKEAPFKKNDLIRHLEYSNIQTRPIFTGNITLQPGFNNIKWIRSKAGYKNTNYIMENGFVIGCHHGLTIKQIDYMKKSFEEFLKKF